VSSNSTTLLFNSYPIKALTMYGNQLWATKLATGTAGDQP
jgi:hypothetical protein